MTGHRYTVEVEPRRHQLHLTLELEGLPPGPLRLAVPTWVPGAYAFLRYARDVLWLRAEDGATGQTLNVTRDGWSGWQIGDAPPSVKVTAQLNAWDTASGELAGLVDNTWALLLGTRYPFAPAHPGPCEVEYRVPEGWPLHHPAGAVQLGPQRYRYESQAALLDAPVVVGTFTHAIRLVGGTPFHALFLSVPLGYEEEGPAFLNGLAKVAQGCHDIFGSFPFADYTFVFDTSAESGWGMEHASSTLVTLDPDVFVDVRRRADAFRVCAHELFHAWNGARLKAAPLGTPDLVAGSFPDGLWLTEGFTRYYEFLLGSRCGWLTPADVLGNLVNYHRHLAMRPAWGRVSAVDSSRAAFLNHHRFPGAVNGSLDYYDQGMLVAFDVDVALRKAGDSLDAAFRDFFSAWAGRGAGYRSDDVLQFLQARLPEAGALATRGVREPGGSRTEASLRALGFEVVHADIGYLGIVLDGNTGPKVNDVADTSPAAMAGLAPGDELLTIDGRPFRLAALRYCLQHRRGVSLTFRRQERMLRAEVEVGKRSDVVALTWAGDAGQAERVRAWLGATDFRPQAGEAIPLDAYDNFHGIQTVL
jgi:predicted metalloprotease with PDZ domain